jgi:hypothetical protein
MSDKIPGVPEGWELVHAMRHAIAGEHYIGSDGVVRKCQREKESMYAYPIIRKIEKPAAFRPFANAAEFKPHRDRWWRYNDDHKESLFPPAAYGQKGHHTQNWKDSFDSKTFDDGTPFGVRIDE